MEIIVCGRAAVEACLKMRPAALREVFADARFRKDFEALQAEASRERGLPWKFVAEEALDHLAGTRRHGGIVARTERPEVAQVHPAMRDEWALASEKILFVENVAEPEALASMARVAVLCGVSRLVADEKKTVPAITTSRAWSLSGGALEQLKIYRTESMAGLLRRMGEKFFVVGLVREGGRKIDYAKPIAFPGKPVALLIGGDANAVPAETASRCGYLLHVSEPEGTLLRYTPAELASQILPWLFSKTKRAGEGFFARKKGGR